MKTIIVFLAFTVGVYGSFYVNFSNSPHTVNGAWAGAGFFTMYAILPLYFASRMKWKYLGFIGMVIFLISLMVGWVYLLGSFTGKSPQFLPILMAFVQLIVPIAILMMLVKFVHGNPTTEDTALVNV